MAVRLAGGSLGDHGYRGNLRIPNPIISVPDIHVGLNVK